MSQRIEKLRENLAAVRSRIEAAARRSGRPVEAVTLVAVTKYVDAEVIRDLVSLGCQDCGESRPQAFWDKRQSLVDLPIPLAPDWSSQAQQAQTNLARNGTHSQRRQLAVAVCD